MIYSMSKSVSFSREELEASLKPEVVSEIKQRLGITSFRDVGVLESNNSIELFTYKK